MDKAIDDNYILTFGMHKGKKLANVPASWLVWLHDQNDNPGNPLWDYIHEQIDDLRVEAKHG